MLEKMGKLFDYMTTLYMASEPTPIWEKAFELIREISEEMSAIQEMVERMNEIMEEMNDPHDNN